MSIKTKLFLMLNGFILFSVLLSLGLTQFCLEKFYIWQKKNVLIENSQAIDYSYQGDLEKISLDLERTANTLGANVVITSPDGQIRYNSFNPLHNAPLVGSPPPPPPPNPIHKVISHEILPDGTTFERQQDLAMQISFLVLQHRLSNQDILFIRQPLAPIADSAILATRFTLFTGLLSILIGGIATFFFAKRFTNPLRELSRIAQKMAVLDFSQKITFHGNDEVGALGQSITHLSTQLDAAITELNQKNQQLTADVEKERNLDKMRREFISNVSHELKTPLALILGYAEGLRENVARDEAAKNDYCDIIIDESTRMDRLIKELLDLSQIEAKMFTLNRSDFHITALITTITAKYQYLLNEQNIHLEIIQESDVSVNGDLWRLEQVVSNLFTNALHHVEGEKIIRIETQELGSHLRLSVYNSGQPIPVGEQEKIWTNFYKVDKARTRRDGSYGLGLSIVRAIQELHQNSYGVQNTKQGVLFWIDLDKA